MHALLRTLAPLALVVATASADNSPYAAADSLSFAARPFVLDDLLVTYNRYLSFPGSETLCPTSVTHADYKADAGDSTRATVLHAKITHASTACTSTGEMLVLPVDDALLDPRIKAALEADTSGVVADALANVRNVSSSLVGFEFEPRVCGEASAVGLPKDSAFLFIHEGDVDVTLVEDVALLPAGPRYAVVVSQTGGDLIACVYSDEADKAAAENTDPDAAKPAKDDKEGKEEGKEGGACFPGDATVELESGAMVRMDELAVGDVVKVGAGEFSRVFMFTHKSAGERREFVVLDTAAGKIVVLTTGHYIYVNGELVPAGDVRVGGVLVLADGGQSRVTKVSTVRGRGLYNPQTLQGDLAVNGVVASTYTTAVDPDWAHAALAPLRGFSEYLSLYLTTFESGAGIFELFLSGGVRSLRLRMRRAVFSGCFDGRRV